MDPTRLQIPLLEHEPSETPVFMAANLLEAAREEDFGKGGDAGLADSLSVCAAALEAALEHGEE
jgi:hypothetical protein